MHMIGFWALLSLLMLSGCEHEFALSEQVGEEEVFSEKVQTGYYRQYSCNACQQDCIVVIKIAAPFSVSGQKP